MPCTDRRHDRQTRSPALMIESVCNLYGHTYYPRMALAYIRHTGTWPSMVLIGTCIARLCEMAIWLARRVCAGYGSHTAVDLLHSCRHM